MNEIQQLRGEITQCPIAHAIRTGNSAVSSPCREIVTVQTGVEFQVPEPWSGQIDTAPILFISSNPSIDEYEDYPDASWESSRTADFFDNRFAPASGWVKDGLYPRQRDGSWRRDWIRFWASARGRASEILERQAEPGIDFALTEVVHCKSRAERGVKDALDACSKRYLERVVFASAAKVLIVYGKHAEEAILHRFGSRMTSYGSGLGDAVIGETSRTLVFLPHPAAYGPKTLEARLGSGGLKLIRAQMVLRN